MREDKNDPGVRENGSGAASPVLRRLRVQIVCVIMIIVTAVLFVIFGIVYTMTAGNAVRDSIQLMDLIAMEPENPGGPENIGQGDSIRLPYFTVELSFDGEIISATGNYFDLSDEEYLMEITEAARSADDDIGELRQYRLRYDKAHFPENGRIVFCDTSAERHMLSGLLRNCLLIGIGAWGLLLLLSILLSRILLHPVERAWQNQRQFVSDASHELKTPLTVILADAEILLSENFGTEQNGNEILCPETVRQGKGQCASVRLKEGRTEHVQMTDHGQKSAQPGNVVSRKMQRQLLENILIMSRNMRGLVEELLELARLDSGAPQTRFDEVDFSTVVENAVLPFEPLFFEKGISLHTSVESGIVLQGSETYLRQLPEIFLDNALKYSTEGGRTVLRLQKTGRDCLLSVSNTGEEIAQEDLHNIFRRFYRVDASRHGSHSYGLGLSIASQTAQMHHGKIWAESAGGINTFCVQIPLERGKRRRAIK